MDNRHVVFKREDVLWNLRTRNYYRYNFHPHRKQNNEGRNHFTITCSMKTILCHIFVNFFILFDFVKCQTVEQEVRLFPPLFNAAQNRPIITEPSQSTCGINSRSAYCKSSIYSTSVKVCNQDFCVQTCPSRTQMPVYKNLLPPTGGFSSCVVADTINRRPRSNLMSYSTSFIDVGPTCFLTPAVDVNLTDALEFSFTVWIWQEKDNDGTLLQKRSQTNGEIIFELNIRQSQLNFVYNSTKGLSTVTLPDEIPAETWTHIAIQVYGTSLSFFLNGIGPGFSATHTVKLVSQVQEYGDSWLRVGLTLSGTYQFLGRIQDFRFYDVTLSNREIEEEFSGVFPQLRVQSDCRCPASHPRVKPLEIHYCIRNGEPDNTEEDMLRLNEKAHPLEYVNDGDSNSKWISKNMDWVNLIVDLEDQFQVFYVVVQFYSPLPMAVEIERQKDDGTFTWQTWQQFADDCQVYFNTVDNGQLATPTSVNCLKLTASQTQYSKGNVTFNILSPEPVPRPGYNDFYNTPELYEFVQASKVRVKLMQHYFVNNDRHKYYGLYEFIVIARCECHGHAETCDHSTLPYQCDCLPESHTQGRLCDECKPLFNDKPFRRGDQIEAFSCQPCECYNHATACTYNISLDPFPNDHYSGGGGVCDDCQHNTEGRFCETCVKDYYRPVGKSMYDVDVCTECDCLLAGVQNMETDCEKEGGQCFCKDNTEGQRCDMCKPGFFNLTADNILGCDACMCDVRGTTAGDDICSADGGECNCKPHVRNAKCDECQYGYYNLTESNPNGCQPCNCNPFGSTNQYCDPDTGQCLCKDHIDGQQCSQCADGYWAFEEGCIPCGCNLDGTEPPVKCDKNTGQCACKTNVEGQKCDFCKEDSFGFGDSEALGCVKCICNQAGTVNGSNLCNNMTGDCVCKENVEGASCNQCIGNTWGLSLSNEAGCVPCDCDPTGTQFGDTLSVEDLSCNQNTGECGCLANRIGRQCDDCDSGYYVSLEPGGGCFTCVCDASGSLPLTQCDSLTGQCQCRGGDSGVTGKSCNECLEEYYGFNHFTGICSPCDCSIAGSVNNSCDPLNGQCFCKEFTFKRRCDRCVKGSSFLEESNPYGCSKSPDQQPPPYHEPLGPTALRISWNAPDYQNGVIQQYRVFRNGSLIFVLAGDERTVDDIGLNAFTMYSYVIEATNAYGSVQSAPISFQTPPGPPEGVVNLIATDIQAKSARFSWNEPQLMNGPLWKYVLYSHTQRDPTRVDQWEGQSLQVSLTALAPFTNYTFHVDSCTTGGCLQSEPVTFVTASAVPEGMQPPVVLAVNNTAVFIKWEPPTQPNGIIIFYELWMRGSLEYDGTRNPPETRIFHPGGQYNPAPTQMPQENALSPPETNFTLSGLKPFTIYEFQVLAENNAGKAASRWVPGRTGAAAPRAMPSPVLLSISPFALNVTWTTPSDADSRGIMILYQVFYYMKADMVTNPFAPPYSWTLMHNATGDEFHYILTGLSPYSEHTVFVQGCNTVGCVNSSSSVGRTQQAVPEGLLKPYVDGYNSSVMNVEWTEPAFPNGPSPYYTIQKTIPALSYPPQVIRGTRFPGGGYYLFPPNTIPPNVEFTGIKFWFKTNQRDGLLLFAASEGRQSEFIAMQFRAGRPWFLFDPQDCWTYVDLEQDPNDDRIITFNDGEWHYLRAERDGDTGFLYLDERTGCASFVSPTNDEGWRYNDNTWHQMIAWRDKTVAFISIDGVFEGVRRATCAKGTIIGPNTGVYVGGLPLDFEIRRSSNDPRLKLIDRSFQGCIRDIQIMQQKYPTEVWKTLDWNDAIANELAFLNWEGCPINLDKGAHFMGQGYAIFPADLFLLGNKKTIEFGFRTQMHTGVIFFAYGGKGIYVYCALINGALHFEFANSILVGSVTFNRPDTNLCDSRWFNVVLEKHGQHAAIKIENEGTEMSGDSNIILNVLTVSDLCVGGIPGGSEAEQFILDNKLAIPLSAFGGCIRDINFPDSFVSLDFFKDTVSVVNVNMDGCTPYHLHSDTCKDDLITQVYNGTEMQVYDMNLQPYTDYLYRVLATNDAGSGTSPWGYGRTKEGAPIGVTAPYEARHISGFLVEVKWKAPISTAGLLTKFVLRSYNNKDPMIDPLEAIITNTSKRIGNVTDLIPHTEYMISMIACTSGGCAESSNGLIIKTKEEAPGKVPAPTAEAGPTYLYLTWDPPGAPNGIITGYFLYQDGDLIYTGGQRAFNVTQDLQIYTAYVFHIKACTQIGCTEGPTVALSTAQLPPNFVGAPRLTPLGTDRIEALWDTPEILNGVLERYVLHLSTDPGILGEEVYNSSDFFLDYVIPNLIAGTTYYVSLTACTGGGCTSSEAANATTAESAPGGIMGPVITSPSPSQLHVVWKAPSRPNGIIIRYDLYHNEVPVYTGLGFEYDIGGLLPYSLHAFRIAACTKKGCVASSLVKGRTQEAAPIGFVIMDVRVEDPRTVSVTWTAPESPNGDLYFDVYFEGLFYKDPENWDYSTITTRRSLHRSQTYSEWVAITPLIPMSSYVVQVNATNSVGYITSNTKTVDMQPGSPDGVRPPALVSQTPTTITATWMPVGRKNALDDPMFILQFREKTPGALVEDIFGPTTSFTYTKENLVAYMEYEFRMVAENSYGATRSVWVTAVTRQDRPAGFAAPTVVGTGPRYIDLIWKEPITPNGILTEYKVYQNGQYRESTDGNVTSLRADVLIPYTYYTFTMEACTVGGCTRSSPSTAVRTFEDFPEQVNPPTAVSLTPASIELKWTEPDLPNGVISLYTLERRLPGKVAVTTVVSLDPNDPKVYVDEDKDLTPFTDYEYRLVVRNGAGEGFSLWIPATTMSSRPAGIIPPVIRILGPTIMNVSWSPPLQPNGIIEFYTVRLPEPRMEIRDVNILSVVFEDLVAYTEYSVTVTACTSGGCTQSAPVMTRTHATVPEGQLPPVTTPVSQSMISVIWQGPNHPNGPNIKFELSRLKIREPLNPAYDSNSSLWESIYTGTGSYYEDRGLPMYSTWRYQITVYNDIGQLTSDPSPDVTTFGGFPRRAADVMATAISHLSVGVSWLTPDEVDLQGSVKMYTVQVLSGLRNYTRDLGPAETSAVFENLTPNTVYTVYVTITIHGGASITSDPTSVKTLDGAPEGVDRPTITIVSETALRVSWMAPEIPNGKITGYNIYVNGEKIQTNMATPGSYVVSNLQPYTVYIIQVEVCTVFDCVKSEEVKGSTLEALPQGMASPRVIPLSPYEINVVWKKPVQPNGIIRRYDVWRKTLVQCSEIPVTTVSPEVTKCTYIQCGILQNLCGSTCYSGAKVCCDGILHESRDGFHCCGKDYVSRSDPSDVCCGGVFHTFKENYQCCKHRYERVPPGEVCCSDDTEDRVTVGVGDSCCGTVPYSSAGAQVCCAGTLKEKYEKQCCGGEMVSGNLVCCGGEIAGHTYTRRGNMSCCGQTYVRDDLSLCCTSDTGHIKTHHYDSPETKESANEKCCGLEKISNSLSCCNYAGYNPVTQVCADVSHQKYGCGSGTVCPRSQKDLAFCDMCDFDPYTYMCGSVSGHHTTVPTPAPPNPADNCATNEERIYSGLELDFLDAELRPYSLYEYSVTVINSAGSTKSDYTMIKTLQARPEGLMPPVATLDPKQLYIIFLSWEPPKQPNGEILRFILSRDGIELYRGLDLMYTDDTTILPYKSYRYTLTACTVAGCISSPTVTVATAQAPPEGVLPPKLSVIDETTLGATWSPPGEPNGIITEYQLHVERGGTRQTYTTTDLSLILNDMQPYTEYNVSLTVCTEVGCTTSTAVSIMMPEAPPQGLQAPRVIINSAMSLDVYWTAPSKPNGEVIFYALLRSQKNFGMHVFLGENFHAFDNNLTPGASYSYFIIAGTKAGNTSSNATTVTMPDNTPADIPPPRNVTVLSSTSVYVEWDPPPPESGIIDQYRVLLNAGRITQIDKGVGLDTSARIENLLPFMQYEVRIQACLQGLPNGCGTGPGVIVQTFEAPPTGMEAPAAVAVGPDVVDISWKEPMYPNGIIIQYLVYYREYGTAVQLLINRLNGETFHIRHAGLELTPYTEYEYKIVAGNSKGDTSSPWTLVRTSPAPPKSLPQPLVTVMGAFAIDLQWVHPAKPNGVINIYKIFYRHTGVDPTVPDNTKVLIVPGTVTSTSVSGLKPYSEYQLQLEAFNSIGSVNSIWVTFKMGESSPSGLGIFDIEKVASGTSVILRWSPPAHPNGIITTYRIYEEGSSVAVFQGLNREFELRRLEPYMEYYVQLEVCTTAGCTRSFSQKFTTAEVAPSSLAGPVMGEITAFTVVVIWVPPVHANGKIIMYEVLRRTNRRIQKRSLSDPVVVHRTTNTDASTYSYTDTNLMPFTEYQYSIRASNSKGSTLSPWQSAFTDQAAPAGVDPPNVNYITDQVDSLRITWAPPDQANGILQSYQLQRNESVPWSFTPQDVMQFMDTGLRAYTLYSYTLTVCSGGGCTTSDPAIIRTKETSPLKVTPPTLFAVNSTALRVTWLEPHITTGLISAYQLHMNGVVIYEGLNMEHTATNLIPFTDYTFKLTACTKGGCTESGEVVGKPEDDKPLNMRSPILKVMSSRSIEVTWQPPEYPNGIITSYDVRRDGRLIYTESISVTGSLRTSYTDYNLEPGTEYAYIVLARNRKGSVESPTAIARTFASSPSGLGPPTVLPLSATSLQVKWSPPANPNGVIKNYTLFREGELVYSGGPSTMNYIVPGLQFWTEYSFRIQACTERGCELSVSASGRTLEARPEELAKPKLLALADQDGAHAGVLVEWEMPLKPNGVIVSTEVYRRQLVKETLGTSYGPTKLVYNGSALQYTDKDSNLLPFTDYQYSVTALNNAGKVSSLWGVVTTKEAPPDSVPAPAINGTTASTISVTVLPPSQPNGIVRYYNVLVNDTVASSGTNMYQTVGQTVPLKPFKFYAITVQACTAGGCTTSPPTIAQTGTAKPSGQEPLNVINVNSTAVKLGWSHPSNPNGEIRRFLLYQRNGCPPTSQPFSQNCVAGEPKKLYEGLYIEKVVSNLSSYSAYEFQIQSANDAGAIDFPVWVRAETTADVPRYIRFPKLQKNGALAVIDWSSSFVLNSKLKEFIIISEANILFRGISKVHSLERSTESERIMFKIVCVTETGQVETPTVVFDPSAVDNIGTTPAVTGPTEAQDQSLKFYEEVWFIVLMILLGVLLLLIVLGCCVRHCGHRHPYIRERLPLQSKKQKKLQSSLSFCIDANDGSLFAMDGPPPAVDKSGYYTGSVTGGVVNPAFASKSPYKRKQKLDNISDTSMFDDDNIDDEFYLWDKNQDSGLVSAYDEDSITAPSYSITKEQTVFTDTHL